MSLYLNFEPHSWYKDFAIKKNEKQITTIDGEVLTDVWEGVHENGITGYVDTVSAETLTALKDKITDYHTKRGKRASELHRKNGEQNEKKK